MKVLPFQIPKPNNDALVYQEDYEFSFYDKLHLHDEIQLSYIVKGQGTLIVGDTVNSYEKGDIIVLGGNLPHVFKSENSKQKSLMLSLFFTSNSFGIDFFELDEMKIVMPFFKRCVNGFKAKSELLAHYFLKLKDQNKLERFIILLNLLKVLSQNNYQPLSTFVYQKKYSDIQGKRMSNVMDFTINNYNKQLFLEEVATAANMTKNAFCKYFKKRTNKTYMQFLTEFRIESACKFLANNADLSIAEIAELSGFNNISNFNRQFKKLKNTTPFSYKYSLKI